MKYIDAKSMLDGEYLEAFSTAEAYGLMMNIDSRELDDKLMNLIDLFTTAKKRGRPVAKVIGTDTESFCREYFETSLSPAQKAKRAAAVIFRYCAFAFAFETLILLFSWEETYTAADIMSIKTDVTGYIVGIVIACIYTLILRYVIRPLFSKHRFISLKSSYTVCGIFIAVVVAVSLLFPYDETSLSVPAAALIGITGLYIFTYEAAKLIIRYRKTGSVSNPERREEKRIEIELCDRRSVTTIAGTYRKRNDRLIMKGKAPLTPDEVMKKICRSNVISRAVTVAAAAYIAYSCVSYAVQTAHEEGIMSGLLFLAVLAVIEGAIMWFFFFSPKSSVRSETRILKKCGDLGVDIFEYEKMLDKSDYDDEEKLENDDIL
ncbi:MAG: DUF1048 domain-containing protein [Firmicutes bacterium]|nr:DUF1048 domain-containing protein [Bacillota bacterium]